MFNNKRYMFTDQGLPSPQTRTCNNSQVVLGLNETETSFLLQQYLTSNAPPYNEASNSFNQEVNNLSRYPSSSMDNLVMLESKQAVKKDRHSKINTSQGPRDRRVRLSIAIARKFFDLQELLGFDKPSKTLDWLLTKSKSAIEDLDRKKNQEDGSSTSKGKNISSASECEVFSAGNFECSTKKYEKQCEGVVIKDDPRHFTVANVVKNTRAKARARARQRTREKMSIKLLHGVNTANSALNFLNPSIPYNCTAFDPRICRPLGSDDFLQESVVIQRKGKQYPSSTLGFHQQNHVSARSMGVNYAMQSSNITSEHWDGFT